MLEQRESYPETMSTTLFPLYEEGEVDEAYTAIEIVEPLQLIEEVLRPGELGGSAAPELQAVSTSEGRASLADRIRSKDEQVAWASREIKKTILGMEISPELRKRIEIKAEDAHQPLNFLADTSAELAPLLVEVKLLCEQNPSLVSQFKRLQQLIILRNGLLKKDDRAAA